MTMTPEILRMYGNKRAEVSHLIYRHLRQNNYSGAKLARELGCSTPNVSKTITGIYHSGLVLDALRALGVPETYLCDPRKHLGDETAPCKHSEVANG